MVRADGLDVKMWEAVTRAYSSCVTPFICTRFGTPAYGLNGVLARLPILVCHLDKTCRLLYLDFRSLLDHNSPQC